MYIYITQLWTCWFWLLKGLKQFWYDYELWFSCVDSNVTADDESGKHSNGGNKIGVEGSHSSPAHSATGHSSPFHATPSSANKPLTGNSLSLTNLQLYTTSLFHIYPNHGSLSIDIGVLGALISRLSLY